MRFEISFELIVIGRERSRSVIGMRDRLILRDYGLRSIAIPCLLFTCRVIRHVMASIYVWAD